MDSTEDKWAYRGGVFSTIGIFSIAFFGIGKFFYFCIAGFVICLIQYVRNTDFENLRIRMRDEIQNPQTNQEGFFPEP